MLGFMNKEAYDKTVETGKVTLDVYKRQGIGTAPVSLMVIIPLSIISYTCRVKKLRSTFFISRKIEVSSTLA